jgi:hypothetical protein
VTLILGMSKADGLYLSTDFRVTRRGKLVDDAEIKHLDVLYPPPQGGGPRALFAYTGLAQIRDGTPTGTWLRETLRGEVEVIDKSMAHLRERLDRDVAPIGQALMINILVREPGRRLAGGFSNVRRDKTTKALVVGDSFGYLMGELDRPLLFANGSGATHGLAQRELLKLRQQLAVWPRKPFDHMKLLATVNRRVAQRDRTISPFCHVTFLANDESKGATSHVFVERGESAPVEVATIMFGIDATGTMRRLQEAVETGVEGAFDATDPDAVKRRP